MNRFAVQAFRRIKFEPAVGAQHIDRADFRDHVRGDMDDDLVEAGLRADRLHHDFAKTAQQQTGAAKRAKHGRFLFRPLAPHRALNSPALTCPSARITVESYFVFPGSMGKL